MTDRGEHNDVEDVIDGLLGEGRLTGRAKERIFDTVAKEVARGRRWQRLRFSWTLGILALSGVTAALVFAPWLPGHRSQFPEFQAKGKATSSPPAVDVSCIGGTLLACPQGATLVFGVVGQAANVVLSAYAEPAGAASGGERIWYFSAEGESPAVGLAGGTQVAPKAVRIGPEHAPGSYRIHVFVTRTKVPRMALLAGDDGEILAKQEIDLRVTAAGAAPSDDAQSPRNP